MLTIPEIDEIAKRATERIAKEFAESGFSNPPVVTHGIARAVLEAAEQSVQRTVRKHSQDCSCLFDANSACDCDFTESHSR